MGIADEIKNNASITFKTNWNTRDGEKVPEPSDLKLGNDAVHFSRATVLYADLDQSTSLVKTKKWHFAAEVYKTYLYAASRLINDAGGTIVSYDGDRVMGIFSGKRQCNDAVRCALKINYAVKHIVQAELKSQYKDSTYAIKHVVGIDTSEIHVARTGVRGDNDLVWVGNSANLAAKLTAESADYPTWITDRVYDYLDDDQKLSNGTNMWKSWKWSRHDNDKVYSSTYYWKF
ncbi:MULTISPECIES: adenylate/guanylate cyclase domain-containing protein [unclassified Mesorhizobium]|uniref:adenylate/guanylate cyclase domain-containing protein n=1 Tax=unclassified Mesorhizobium TaxID=325217 RepID=UPI001209790F|nr:MULTISPECIES: adenylate/guanylate cyclase domain-containing protein [unclassified Mesorhizobium]MDG4887819.1 adenylate/guanylate cyclase domain-containing protein [Mesorhizobium sp. WSM4887]TIQ07689.1 MAG: adenylate/guanylate cyclase domain-containing protein [Mesorhizobium sp.]